MLVNESKTFFRIIALTFWKGIGAVLSGAIAIGIANSFGAGSATDAYFFARKLISNIAVGFERAFHLVQLPPLIQKTALEGLPGLKKYLLRLSCWTGLITCCLAVLGIIWAEPIIKTLAPGFDEAQVQRTVPYLQALFLTMPISAVTGLAGATLNAFRIFSIPAVARLLPRFCVLLVLVFMPLRYGIGALIWALLFGTLCMGVFFIWAIIRAFKTTNDLPTHRKNTDVARYGKGRIVAMVFAQFHMIGASWIDMAFASLSGVGGVASLEFGQRLTNVVPGVAANSVTSVYYTEFSHHVGQNDTEAFRTSISRAIRAAFFFSLPIATVVFVIAPVAVDVILRHGAFTAEAAHTTAMIVQTLALLLPFNAVLGVFVSAMFADATIPHIKVILSSTIVSMTVRVACASALVGMFGVVGVPIASLIAMMVLFILCGAWLTKFVGLPLRREDARGMLAILLTGGICFITAWTLLSFGEPFGTTRPRQAIVIGGVVTVSGCVFLCAARLLKVQEVVHITDKIMRKVTR